MRNRVANSFNEHSGIVDALLAGDAELASDAALDHWLRHHVTSSYHLAGTCKMGPASDPMAVVDQWCHVHGLSGLRVADASIMPDVVRANTNVTTMMIAERCANFIKAGH